jgi:ribosomal protein S18 acetylase RimI-like enzyme
MPTRPRALLEGHGYRPVRHFLRMQIDMAEPPAAPDWPAGVTASAFRPDEDAADVHACVHEALAEEWSFRAETLGDWSRRKLEDDPRFDPSLWVVAREGGEVCAVALCTAGQFDMGFVNSLAVRPRWRRRGLGLALLRHAFGVFWERGEHRVGLGVDTANPTAAVRLYERAGMRSVWQATSARRSCGAGKRGPPPAAGMQPALLLCRRSPPPRRITATANVAPRFGWFGLSDGRRELVEAERLGELGLGPCTDRLGDDLAVLDEDDRRDRRHSEPGGDAWLGVDVELADLDAAGVVARELVDDRAHHAAGTAPGGPHVEQDGHVGLGDLGLEVRGRDLD